MPSTIIALLLLAVSHTINGQGCQKVDDCADLGQNLRAACENNECKYTIVKHTEQRRNSKSASILNSDGNVVIQLDAGKTVGYKVGEQETIDITDMPEAYRAYSDASVTALGLGYEIGAVKAESLVANAKLDLTKDMYDIERNLTKKLGEVEDEARQLLTEGASQQVQRNNEFNESLQKQLQQFDKVMGCNYPNEYFNVEQNSCLPVKDCPKSVVIQSQSTFSDRQCVPWKSCGKVGEFYEIAPGTSTSQPSCAKVSIRCPDGSIQASPATATSDIGCKEVYSCTDIKANTVGTNPSSGKYLLNVDSASTDMTKITKTGKLIEVYCLKYDGDKFYTLFEMVQSSQNYDNKYAWLTDRNRFPVDSSIGQMWESNQNQPARLSVMEINSIFKHSKGYVQTRYADNQAGYQVTDVFGDPANNKHILDPQNKCSHKDKLSIALGYRAPSSDVSKGYCMNDGLRDKTNNCICSDTTGSQLVFNKCKGQYGNWRRYNSFETDNLNCRAMHGKCSGGTQHFPPGDTYGCNKGGQRSVEGHFWFSYSNGHRGWGMPCSGYYDYGCYGSRWIF